MCRCHASLAQRQIPSLNCLTVSGPEPLRMFNSMIVTPVAELDGGAWAGHWCWKTTSLPSADFKSTRISSEVGGLGRLVGLTVLTMTLIFV